MRKFSRVLAGITIMILAALACNLPSNNPNQQQDPGAIMTAAALTVQAKLPATAPIGFTAPAPTQTTAPTAIPFPTIPPTLAPPPATPTSNCDNGQFIVDVSYPDNTVVTGGTAFVKTWRLKNIGSCSWTPSYALVFVGGATGGDSMSGPSAQALTGNVNPGQSVDISVNLTAPSGNGTYKGNWGLRNAAGVIFAHFYVQVKVGDSGGGAFAVTSVSFNVTGSCPNFNLSVTVTANGAGTVNLHRVWTSGTDSLPKTLTFSGAGSQSIDYGPVYSASNSWTDVYIDSPNHQQFGRANFVCP